MKEEKKRVIKSEELKKTKEWAKEILNQWHSKRPDYIFLTETAGTLYGYALKEAWKNAYPNEKLPIFYRIDPVQISRGPVKKLLKYDLVFERLTGEEFKQEKEKYFEKRIKKENPRIIVFDEGVDNPKMSDFKKYRGTNPKNSAGLASDFIYKFLKDNKKKGIVYTSRQGISLIRTHARSTGGNYWASKSPTSKRWHDKKSDRYASYDEFDQFHHPPYQIDSYFKGRIVKNPEQRKRAINYINELKRIGKGAGKELYKEKNKKDKRLENKLSAVVGIAGICVGLLFLSSNITGNVIGNLTQNSSNIIGLSSFLIGLVGAFFYFRKK